jgi:hypothetical protein
MRKRIPFHIVSTANINALTPPDSPASNRGFGNAQLARHGHAFTLSVTNASKVPVVLV